MALFDVFYPLKNVTPRFTEEQLNEIDEWFDNNAKPLLVIDDGPPINVISIEQIIMFLELKKFHRRSFSYPSYGEIMTQAEILKAGVLRVVTKDQFLYMLNKWVLEPEIKHELLLAFKVFDKEKRDFLEIDDLQAIVTSFDDVFNQDETREMIRDANVRGDGYVYYDNFVESMFLVAPELYEIKTEYLYDDPDEDPSVPPEPVKEEEPPPVAAPPPPQPPTPAKSAKKKK